MADRIKYKIGDIFQMPLDENSGIGYGRILLIDKPSIFIELYEVNLLTNELSTEEIKNLKPLFSVWSTDNGLKKGLWIVIGNIPVDEEVKIPDFWTTDAFTDKILLVSGTEKIEIKKEEIGDLDAAGIYGHEAVRLTYLHRLKERVAVE